MNQKPITDRQVDVLAKAMSELLETVITCPALFEYLPRANRKPDRLSFGSECMNVKKLGDFAHIIAEYCVGVRVGVSTDQTIIANVYFYYTHTTGGRNGHTLDFHIEGNLDGTDLIIVKKSK